MGGGTTGQIQRAAKKQGTRQASWENLNKYKRDKLDPLTTAAQRNIGEASSDAMSSFEMGMEGVQEFVERNTRSLMPQDSDDQGSSSAEANYSSSSSGSKSGGQGGKKKGDLKQKKNKQNLSKRSLIKKKQ